MSAPIEGAAIGYAVDGRALVQDVMLRVESGGLTVIVGPNGAGKSTLVRMLTGELRPSVGAALCLGEPVGRIPGWRLACQRAVLPQASRLAFPFTVRQIARIGQDGVGRGLSARDRSALVGQALARADVGHLADRSYQTLSGGEQQRTQFARVLAQLAAGRTVVDRQAIILDEPIASLDLRHQLALLDHATALAADGVAVLAVLHDLNLAAAFADEIVVMAGGRVVAAGVPVAVLNDAILSGVFGLDLKVGQTPADGRPFVLPRRSGAALSPPS